MQQKNVGVFWGGLDVFFFCLLHWASSHLFFPSSSFCISMGREKKVWSTGKSVLSLFFFWLGALSIRRQEDKKMCVFLYKQNGNALTLFLKLVKSQCVSDLSQTVTVCSRSQSTDSVFQISVKSQCVSNLSQVTVCFRSGHVCLGKHERTTIMPVTQIYLSLLPAFCCWRPPPFSPFFSNSQEREKTLERVPIHGHLGGGDGFQV